MSMQIILISFFLYMPGPDAEDVNELVSGSSWVLYFIFY
jgi:hypothetical protein